MGKGSWYCTDKFFPFIFAINFHQYQPKGPLMGGGGVLVPPCQIKETLMSPC